jgi:integrase
MGLNIKRIGPNLWFLDVRVKKNGHQERRRESFAGTKFEAEERYLKLRQELQLGPQLPLLSAGTTFADAMAYYREKRFTFSAQDKSRYDSLIRELGPIPIPEFANKFDRYLAIKRKYPCKKTGKPPKPATINRLVEMVRAAFNLAVEAEWLEKNPITKRRFPKAKEVARDRVLTLEEEGRLLLIVHREAPHIYPLIRFALAVPCRKSELVNMRIEDLDLINNAIRVRNGTTKNDDGTWKPIPPDQVPYFRSIPPGCPFVFYRVEAGRFFRLGDFRKSWTRCLLLAGITDFRLHDTRHASATRLVDNGTPEQVVNEIAGWKTNMLRTYYHRAGKKSLTLVRFTPGSNFQDPEHEKGTLGVRFGLDPTEKGLNSVEKGVLQDRRSGS